MVLTLSCVAVALFSPLLVGIPVRWLLQRGRPLEERGWLEAPFVGLATIILPLQGLVYLDIPLRQSVPWFWMVVATMWVLMVWRRSLLPSFQAFPGRVLACCLAVYALQGVGLFHLGADAYLGRTKGDQFNYIVLAQFFSDLPFSTGWNDLGERPYLVIPLALKGDRIGQSILQGFFAVTRGCESFSLYEATSLLSPALLVIPIYLLLRRLGQSAGRSLLAGCAAGLLPAVTVIHLEGYLSQALCIPLLYFFLVTLEGSLREPTAEHLGLSMLVSATAVSVYTEFQVIFIGLTVLGVGAAVAVRSLSWRRGLLLGLAIPLAPLILNPGFTRYLIEIASRVQVAAFTSAYSHFIHLRTLGAVWLGDFVSHSLSQIYMTKLLARALTVTGLVGLFSWLAAHLTNQGRGAWQEPPHRQGFVVALLLVALATLPILAILHRPPLPYQFYKLLLTIGPLFVVGIALVGQRLSTVGTTVPPSPRWLVWTGNIALGLTLLQGGCGSFVLERESALDSMTFSSLARHWNEPEMQRITRHLAQMPSDAMVMALTNADGKQGRLWWLSYFGRRHRLWLTNDRFNGDCSLHDFPASALLNVDTVPADCQFLLSRRTGFRIQESDTCRLTRSGMRLNLYHLQGGRWAIPLALRHAAGRDLDGEKPCRLDQGPATIDLLARSAGRVTLRLALSETESAPLHVRVQNGESYDAVLEIAQREANVSLPVSAGRRSITLTMLDAPAGKPLMVEEIGFAFTPEEGIVPQVP